MQQTSNPQAKKVDVGIKTFQSVFFCLKKSIQTVFFPKWSQVSKIYMTACMCIYKFCQIKKYVFMIFSCFIQKPERHIYHSSWFFIFYLRSWMITYYILLKKYSSFINDYDEFFMNFQDFSWYFFTFYFCSPF